MRNIIIYIGALFLIVLTSCQENERMLYSAKAGIYFQVTEEYQKTHLDSLVYSFATGTKVVDTIPMTVKIVGEAVEYDRTFKVSIVDSLTSAQVGTHYKALEAEYTLPANELYGAVPVILFNTDTLLRDSTFRIGFRIEESEDFDLGVEEKLVAKLLFSDQLTMPPTWSFLKYFFGDYDRIKHKYFIQNNGLDFPTEMGDIYAAYGLWKSYGVYLNQYFVDNYPIYNESGEIVEPWQ